MRRICLPIFAATVLIGLAGCNGASTSANATTAATGASGTAAKLVSASTATKGQEFCSKATADGPLVVALANSQGAPVAVTGLASSVVAAACAAWDAAAVPVSPPVVGVLTVAIPVS
jgi:hypothetical protein